MAKVFKTVPGFDPVQIRMEVFGDVQVSRKLLRFGEHALEAEALWESLYEDFLHIEEEQFDSEGKRGSGGWAPLQPSTLAARARKGYIWPDIERASGALFESLARRDAPGQIFEKTPGHMIFGSSIFYGGFQQSGTVKMPQRKLVEFTETDKVLILKKVQMFIVHGEVGAL